MCCGCSVHGSRLGYGQKTLPTGISPRQVVKRAYDLGDQVKGRRKLTYSTEPLYRDPPKPAGKWTAAEAKALVDYILLTGPGNSWPHTINALQVISFLVCASEVLCPQENM